MNPSESIQKLKDQIVIAKANNDTKLVLMLQKIIQRIKSKAQKK